MLERWPDFGSLSSSPRLFDRAAPQSAEAVRYATGQRCRMSRAEIGHCLVPAFGLFRRRSSNSAWVAR
jgi:hypothetical protein